MQRPEASPSSRDTREIKLSKNERDWLEYVSELLSVHVRGDKDMGYRIDFSGDDMLREGGKDNMVRRCQQIVRRYDKAGGRRR